MSLVDLLLCYNDGKLSFDFFVLENSIGLISLLLDPCLWPMKCSCILSWSVACIYRLWFILVLERGLFLLVFGLSSSLDGLMTWPLMSELDFCSILLILLRLFPFCVMSDPDPLLPLKVGCFKLLLSYSYYC